ncbi:lysozyme inhibitor LprI family protein [Paraburkholderia sp.]|uniref:lysozyme inhibitor LprI family protein n=1 Tax=Paraburkholderia sp. TaxID=1926495 RepID=UPI002388E729|nr:lysozyme inhibitor LprI family protein [Paraburkholderia sp.]MDE1182893.1 LprI family protein [Paraburkholderia sp.]
MAAMAMWLTPGLAHAEVAAADPIDAAMRACLARSDMSSTVGQIQCMDTARIGWHAALDTAWQQLQSKLPPAQRTKWQKSQTAWLAWRDAEEPLLGAVIATTQGTMYRLAAADMQLQPVRDRALALRSAAAAAQSGATTPRLRACSADAQCEHAMFDLNRYYRRLVGKMPVKSRALLTKAQRAWTRYRDATSAVVDERGRIDIIGGRVATVKRLSETVGND